MALNHFFDILGVVGGAAMPLFNIPLILRIYRRKTCDDISLTWMFGVWVCILMMSPSSIKSHDVVLKAFGVSNLFLFSLVVGVVSYYRFIYPKRKEP